VLRKFLVTMLVGFYVSIIAPAQSADTLRDPTRPYTPPAQSGIAQKQFVVNAIFVSEDRRIAIINGKLVTQGDAVDGAEVIEILNDSVRLDNHGKSISSWLAGSGLRNKQQAER
jgi:MSHA biogenesis protein MshK